MARLFLAPLPPKKTQISASVFDCLHGDENAGARTCAPVPGPSPRVQHARLPAPAAGRAPEAAIARVPT